jgi:hypothetical protein
VVSHVVAGEVGGVLGEPGEEQGDVAIVDAEVGSQVRGRRHDG